MNKNYILVVVKKSVLINEIKKFSNHPKRFLIKHHFSKEFIESLNRDRAIRINNVELHRLVNLLGTSIEYICTGKETL